MSVAMERRIAALEAGTMPPVARLSPVEVATQLGLELDEWQKSLVLDDWRQAVLNCSRQSGKSTVAGLLALTMTVYRPNTLVLVLSPTERQSGLLFRQILRNYRALGHPVAADVENRLSLELSNGSAVHALPGSESSVRGFSAVDLLVVDEASRVPDELFHAIRPMLATSGGRTLLLSSPFGRRGFFWKVWETGENWRRTEVKATKVSRIDPEWLKKERNLIGEWAFRQEFLCEFVDNEDQLFRSDLIAAAITDAVTPLFPHHGSEL